MRLNIALEDIIPSQDVRKHLLELGWTFTDREIATLLIHGYNNSRPVERLFSGLQTLYDETADQDLRMQIGEYLNKIGSAYQTFQQNKDKTCIYILKIQNEEAKETYYPRIHPSGYFFDFEMACAYGRKEKVPFQITKNLVGDPNLMAQGEDEYYDYEIDYLEFNRDGVTYYFSAQLDEPQEDVSCERFETAYVEIPNPFERGDIVRFIGKEEYGIVETSQKCWKESLERYRKNNWKLKMSLEKEGMPYEVPLEFGDNQIRVVFLNEDGTFSHKHIIPFNLERYEPRTDEWGRGTNPMDRLLVSASDLYRGEGSLDELYFDTMNYRKANE